MDFKQKISPTPKGTNIRNRRSPTHGIYRAVRVALGQRFMKTSIFVAVFVWTVWLILLGPIRAFSILGENWEPAVTMIFGSMTAGGTSLGGGAVAFPVFTKVLQVPPLESKIFSLAIQSAGMSAASLTIVAMRTKVEWPFIRWATLGGIPGIIIGSAVIAPLLPPNLVKFAFTMMLCSFGIFLIILNWKDWKRKCTIASWGYGERVIALATGLFGGLLSGLVGSGIDVFSFSVLVLLFGVSEKVSTPTSVILMGINAVTGFILHKFFIGDFVEPVVSYWLAAVPVVVVGAPVGAMLCSLLSQEMIAKILIALIGVELVSSFLLIPLDITVVNFCLLSFALFSSIYYWMYFVNVKRQRSLIPESE